jgi:hypothetical protein
MQDKLAFPMGHMKNGHPCCYQIHMEEVFLFTLCRLATGFTQIHIVGNYIGRDTNCWIYAYPWMLNYLNERYLKIIGYQGLTRFVSNFLHFKHVIEQYVQRNQQQELVDGTMMIAPSLNYMPWNVFGFIDDLVNCISTPFSGPRRDYEGATCKVKYANVQQVFYLRYAKDQGIKV